MARGPNEALIGASDVRTDLATPALLVDLDRFEANLATMAELVTRHGRQVRPHVKAHKSSQVGRRQIEAGAVGLCCATVLEAETMAAAGSSGVLVTTPVVTSSMIRRIVAARERIDELLVVVDCDEGIERLAAQAKPERPIGVLVDIDMGLGRTGIIDPAEGVRLARAIGAKQSLRYRGVQAYYGHLQHVPALVDRRAKVGEQWAKLARFVEALEAAGLAPEIVSGGGTGSHHLDLTEGPYTEIQPGSYLFMDKQYNAVEIAPGGVPFATSLNVAARVVSTVQPDRVIVDAGFKAMATDAGPALLADDFGAEVTHQFMGDEHSALRFADPSRRPKLGDLVRLVAPHCDPTVNLHDWLHVVRGNALVDIWPVEARGY
jgi:D-serine deaminase-like pyridoxal phosphate-dependent protein